MITPSRKELKRWIKWLGLTLLIAVAINVPIWIGLRNAHAKGARITTRPGVPTALRQIWVATKMYEGHLERKPPSSLEDLVGMTVATSKGQLTNFSISMLEQELGAKISTIKYFPGFSVLGNYQVPREDVVLAYVPDSKDTQYCHVVYRSASGSRSKRSKWLGPERMEVARVNQQIEWLSAYKNAIESNLPPPTAPMPR